MSESSKNLEKFLDIEIPCRSTDGKTIMVSIGLLMQSKVFCSLYNNLDLASMIANNELIEFPISTSAEMVEKAVKWMEINKGAPEPVIEENLVTHERVWFKFTDEQKAFLDVSAGELTKLMKLSNFLDLKSLYLFSAQMMAERIRNKSPEEIRNMLGLEDDLTEEEKAQIRRDNVWCNY